MFQVSERNLRYLKVSSATVLICLLLTICSVDYSTEVRPNILIISVSSLKWGYLDAYNGTHKVTPNIARFANQSFIFDNAIADISLADISFPLSQIKNEVYIRNRYVAIGKPWSAENL